jgi:spermidine/putrescine-binding protein
MKISRRSALKITLSLPVAAAAAGSSALAQDTTLRVATWGGSWKDAIDKNIASRLVARGIKVDYVLGNPDDNLAKLIAARRQNQVAFDVMEGHPYFTAQMSKAGLLDAMNLEKMPNVKAAPKWAVGPTHTLAVTVEDGIIYNRTKLAEAGIEPPKRYSDLTNPKLRGHVAFPDISNAQHWNAVVGLAYENGGNEDNLDAAAKMVNEIAPSYFFSASTELATKMGAGDIWAVPWHSGWAVRLRRGGVPVGVSYTKFGDKTGALWPVPQFVVKGAQNADAAYAFIDTMFATDAQYEYGKATGSVPTIGAARAKLADDPDVKDLLFVADADMDRAFQIDWSRLDEKKWRDTWTRQVKR